MTLARPARPATGWTPPALLVLAVVCLLVLWLLAACGLKDGPRQQLDQEQQRQRVGRTPLVPAPGAPREALPAPTLSPTPLPRATRSRPLVTRTAPRVASRHRGQLADVTAYCDHGTMANGQQTYSGAVASLSRAIPFGTRVLIDGRTYTVADRIGHGSTWDVWLPSCAAADRWGRRHLHVTVLS